MKVAIINRSDLRGGAAVFTYRLMHALRRQGVEATMLACDVIGNDPHVIDYAHPLLDKFHFLAERVQIFCNNGFSRDNLFKVDTAQFGRNICSHPVVQEADVIMLNWINQGALSLDAISQLCRMGKPVVWTMHDMWNCTGVCHHAYDCTRYHDSCGACPYLASASSHDLSYTTWCKKKKLYEMPNLHFVSVSQWLCDKCATSALMRHKPVAVIPNSVPVDEFSYCRKPNSDYNLPPHVKVIAMGAARLDDPVKGFDILIDTSRHLVQQHPDCAQTLHLLLFGDIRNAALLQQLALPYTHLGRVCSDEVNHIMTHADIVLSTSLYESFGGTLIEGMASGCVPVTFGNGGQTDIVSHLHNGYIARYKSAQDIAQGIKWAVNNPIDRVVLHDDVAQRFSPHVVARRYIDLMQSL